MKNFLAIVCACAFLISCSNGTDEANNVDTMNGIHDQIYNDTTVSPRPDGYAPPNTTTNTSEKTKDSIK